MKEGFLDETVRGSGGDDGRYRRMSSVGRAAREEKETELVELWEHAGGNKDTGEGGDGGDGRHGAGGGGEKLPEEAPYEGRSAGIKAEEFGRKRVVHRDDPAAGRGNAKCRRLIGPVPPPPTRSPAKGTLKSTKPTRSPSPPPSSPPSPLKFVMSTYASSVSTHLDASDPPTLAADDRGEITAVVGEEHVEGEDGEEECGFCLFMKGGGCKETFVAWEKCVEEAEKLGEDIVGKCSAATALLKKCMDAHAEYYEPILRAEEAMLDAAASAADAAASDAQNTEEHVEGKNS